MSFIVEKFVERNNVAHSANMVPDLSKEKLHLFCVYLQGPKVGTIDDLTL